MRMFACFAEHNILHMLCVCKNRGLAKGNTANTVHVHVIDHLVCLGKHLKRAIILNTKPTDVDVMTIQT